MYTCSLDFTSHDLRIAHPIYEPPPMNRPYRFGNRNAKSLMVVHLLLIVIVTVAMVTTLPTLALIG